MHQQPRAPPRAASPTASPQANSPRTTNPRDAALPSRPRTGSEVSGRSRRNSLSSPTTADVPAFGPHSDSIRKLDQILQNFHTKAAALVLESRVTLRKSGYPASGSRKPNKWFQIETDDFDDFRDDLRTWRTCGSFDNRPPPMIIETYLDTSKLTSSQSLVVVDDSGKRWDVMEALNASDSSSGGSSGIARRNSEVILERWRIDLRPSQLASAEDFGPILPTIYKKAIVFFRSLYLATRVIPAWKFTQHAKAKGAHPALEPRCRFLTSDPVVQGHDRLRHPLFDASGEVVTDYVFGDLEVPVGRFYASVTYRNDCSFRVDDSEALLSSRFMGVDENFFKPSLPSTLDKHERGLFPEPGSLPSHRHTRPSEIGLQTYGSLSTFHGDGALGTSPISALRAVPTPGSDAGSPPNTAPIPAGPEPSQSLPTSGYRPTTRPSIRPVESGRRPSVSFQSLNPFKAGSLSGSPVPRTNEVDSPASPHSLSRAGGLASLTQARNRTSLTAGMPASLRGVPTPVDVGLASSPRPTSTSRYSSSFTHRRGRLSFSGMNKPGDDEQGSSGRGSLASSVAQPGSGLLTEAGAGGSSGSLQTDDDNISEFLKVIESRKNLKSFEPARRGESATNRTVAQLSRFHNMRESNNLLTESMSSSMQMHRSSSSSSRQLTSVPGMVAPASLSTSSSPGKPLSPHTPHTPAIPSRLSENSVAEHNQPQRRGARGGTATAFAVPDLEQQDTITQDRTTAIDIPLSPRIGSHGRRASSVAQQSRGLALEDDTDLAFAHRSISLGADERDPPTMSILRGAQTHGGASPARSSPPALQSASQIRPTRPSDMMRQGSTEGHPPADMPGISSSPFGRRRYTGMMNASAGRGQTPPQSSRGSYAVSSARFSRGENELDEEPLVFDMSEMDAQSRRSLEEARGGGNAGSMSGSDRRAFEPRGTSHRGW